MPGAERGGSLAGGFLGRQSRYCGGRQESRLSDSGDCTVVSKPSESALPQTKSAVSDHQDSFCRSGRRIPHACRIRFPDAPRFGKSRRSSPIRQSGVDSDGDRHRGELRSGTTEFCRRRGCDSGPEQISRRKTDFAVFIAKEFP